MRKLLIIAIVAAMIASLGAAFAQAVTDRASHEVWVNIPGVAMIRLTSGASNAAVTANTAVNFSLNPAQVGIGATPIAPIAPYPSPTRWAWDNVMVYANRSSTWNVTLGVVQSEGAPAAFAWSSVTVPVIASGGLASPFNLGIASTTFIAASNVSGWSSLGFGQGDFRLTLAGTELAGLYTATVTYTLTSP